MLFRSKNPLKFLCIDKMPNFKYILLMLIVMVVSTPAMNYIVEWNENIKLPESMAAIEQWIRESENAAKAVTDIMLSNDSVPAVIVTILIVGVLTGFGEEIFFRGMMQRILSTKPMNIHLSIWLVAFIFSALHFQFFGFVPRMLLGAFFGYLLDRKSVV